MTFSIKKGNTSPNYVGVCQAPAGTVKDITGATSVRFHMANTKGAIIVDAAAAITDAAAGEITYTWDAADTAISGIFRVEIEVTYSDGTIETFPNDSYNVLQITEVIT